MYMIEEELMHDIASFLLKLSGPTFASASAESARLLVRLRQGRNLTPESTSPEGGS